MKTTGIWKTWENVVRVHATGCNMTNVATGRGIVALNEEEIQDMRDRGYGVVTCKCVKEKA